MKPGAITIAGGGPAGAAAAIAASYEGAPVRVIERSTGPRHRVCGEFMSPGIREFMEAFGLWNEFAALEPPSIRRCVLHLGKYTKQWTFPEPAWGLSRLKLDSLLLNRAEALGAEVRRGEIVGNCSSRDGEGPLIDASGRQAAPRTGERLFGFKAHFEGPCDDAVELFFDSSGYTGVSSIENGLTNVCGLARESTLRKHGFDFDAIVRRMPSLAERLAPLRRTMKWLAVAQLCFSLPAASGEGRVYRAGDAAGFVDPFTGSGILGAISTGWLAGLAAARGAPQVIYQRLCRRLLQPPFMVSSALRRVLRHAELYSLARIVPGRLLFRLTRMDVARAVEAGCMLG
jgi:flavin-dependent dehydrogenase